MSQLDTFLYDGGRDVHKSLALSGETVFPQIAGLFGEEPRLEQSNATDIAANNIRKRKYQKEYLDYWNGTARVTGTGRPVDAWILPAAPFTAARPGRYDYYGYTFITNILDYPTAVIPVTTVDKAVDIEVQSYNPLNDQDRKVWESCKWPFEYLRINDGRILTANFADNAEVYNGAPVAVQVVGRRFEEEKLLTFIDYIDEALRKLNE